MVVATVTVAMVVAMVITAVAATVMQEVALPGQGDAITVCDTVQCCCPVGCIRHCMAPWQ